jgi:hypothetical protein
MRMGWFLRVITWLGITTVLAGFYFPSLNFIAGFWSVPPKMENL